MSDGERPGLISTQALAERPDDPAIRIIDGSWFLPSARRSGRGEYDQRHIEGAAFFDIDAISDSSTPLPHMLPPVDQFAAAAGAMGISHRHRIVVYDGLGMFSAARVRWMFLVMGATDISVLDGGFPKWIAEGRPVSAEAPTYPATTFAASLDTSAVVDLATMRHISASPDTQIIDARPGDRFLGEAPEPRKGVRSGHVPGSHSMPLETIVADGRLKPAAEIERAFAGAGVDLTRPIVTSCGSGVTAAVIGIALEQLGVAATGLYDGSWAEWGGRDDTQIATGARD